MKKHQPGPVAGIRRGLDHAEGGDAGRDLELRFVHVKAPQACRKSLAELVDANDRGFHDDDVTELTVEGGD
jgi:hypothetical protein